MSKNIINIGLYEAYDSMPVEGYKFSDTLPYNNFAYIGIIQRKLKEMISQIVSEYPIITEDKVSICGGHTTTIERPDVEIHLYIKECYAEIVPAIFAIVGMNIPLTIMEFDDITRKYYSSEDLRALKFGRDNIKVIDGYYVDNNNNRWDINYYSEEEACIYSFRMLLCKNCTNCSYCNNCTDCTSCNYCSNCDRCTACDKCNDCVNCNECLYCTNCSECNNCNDCMDCSECSNCNNCDGL